MPRTLIWNGANWDYSVDDALFELVTLVADGTDQTTSLQNQLNAVPDGISPTTPKLVMLPSGSFRIDGRITLNNRSNLLITAPDPDGQFVHYSDLTGLQLVGYTDANSASTRQHWLITGCSNVQIRRVKVRGPNTERDSADNRFAKYASNKAFEHPFAIQGASSNVQLVNCECENVYGDAVYIGGTGSPNVNITVENYVGRTHGRQGVGLVNATNTVLRNVDCQWGARSGLDVEPNHDTHFVDGLTCENVTMGSKSFPFVLGGDAGDNLQHLFGTFSFDGCTGKNAASSHPAIFAASAGDILIVRTHTDLRYRGRFGIHDQATWDSVTVEDSTVTCGPSSSTVYGFFAGGIHAATVPTTLPATVTSGSSTVLCPQVVGSDADKQCYGAGVPNKIEANPDTYVKVSDVVPGVSFKLRRADTNALFNATASNTAIVIVRNDPLVGQPEYNGTPIVALRRNSFPGAVSLASVNPAATFTHCGNNLGGATIDGACP